MSENAAHAEMRPGRGAGLAEMASTGALVVAGAVMLSWVALYNGAPLVFADTIAYASAALQRELPGMFSIFYSVLILPLHQGVTLWPVVLVQGAMLTHLLYLTTRCATEGRVGKPEVLAIIAGLCILSGLPWITGQVLPDVFTSVLLLGLFLLGFCADQLRRGELFYVGALTTAAITTHFSHVPIALGLIALCIVLKPMFGPTAVRLRRWAALVLIPFVVAVGSMLAVNWLDTREIGFARNSNVFLLAKWIDEGPALSYLIQACPTAGYALCAHVDALKGKTHDDLKWAWHSPFKKVGTFDELEPEARRIVGATLRAHPFAIAERAVIDAGRQLLRFQAGDGLSPDFARMVARHLAPLFGPEMAGTLVHSRQGQGALPIVQARRLHMVGLALAMGLCLWCIVLWRQALPRRLVALYVFVGLGVVCNAIVTGALSGPYDRYLARVIWLVCFAGLVTLCLLVRGRQRQPGTAVVRGG